MRISERLPVAVAFPRAGRAPSLEARDTVELSADKPGPARLWRATALAACVAVLAAMGVAGAEPIAPPSLEQQLEDGRRCEWQVLRRHRVGDDPVQEQRLRELSPRLLRHAERSEIPYRLTLTRGHGNWAAACGNGALFVDQELGARLSDGELLFTAAHELGHTERGHQAERAAYLDSVGWRLLLPWRGDRAELDAMGRQSELEADCFALGVLEREGYGPETAASALGKILAGVEEQGGDHPSLQARLENLRRCP